MESGVAASPLAIRVEKAANRLVIDWSDGFRTSFPWTYLRANCPSAGERASRDDPNPLAILKSTPSSEVVAAKLVGNYALNITWADGHNAGIYTWEYLLALARDPKVERTAIV